MLKLPIGLYVCSYLKWRLLVWAILCSSILRDTSIFGIGIRKEPGIQSDSRLKNVPELIIVRWDCSSFCLG
jgi:hypothetical protein